MSRRQLYYYSPSLLTVLSLFCLVVAILDYVGPIVSSALWKQENWTPSKERQLESICKSLAAGYLSVRQGWHSMLELRSNRPGMVSVHLFYYSKASALRHSYGS
jgi:hypothetical protein